MRCPDCQYALWNLKESTCPECGRGFELGEWDFSGSDAAFACTSCGERLVGATPKELPTVCPACGVAIDARSVSVGAGASGKDVPRAGDPDRVTRIGGLVCTSLMALSVCFGVLVVLTAAGSGGHGVEILMFFAIIGTMAGFAGVWPTGERRRVLLVFSLLVFMVVGSIAAISVGNRRRHQGMLSIKYSTVARAVIQAVDLHRQQNGSFPSNPQELVDQGFMPIELFYEHGAGVPQQLTWTQLPGGWIEIGMFRIDWNEPSWGAWNGPHGGVTPVIFMAPSQRFMGTSVGFADLHVEYYSWSGWAAQVQKFNTDRAAAGVKAIPSAALPSPP